MKTAVALFVSFLALVPHSARAQAKPASDTAISPSRLAAAEELLEATDTEKGIRDGMRAYFDMQAQQNPLMTPYIPTMAAFAEKYLVWSEIKPRLARIYAQALTQDQLRAAIAFHRSPAGKAFTAHQIEMQRAMMDVVQSTLASHTAELQQMIQQRAAELNKPGAAATKRPR